MSSDMCVYEAAVIEATRTGEWAKDLRAHVLRCAACTDAARVSAWMQDLSGRLGRNRPARDPAYIWLRAEIARRAREENASALRRSVITALLSLAATGISAAAVLAAWPHVAAGTMTARSALSNALTSASLADVTLISSGGLGLSALLVGTYLLVLRPSR